MKFAARKEKMLSLLDVYETMTVQQLVDLLGASPATIRRDIVRMEESGELQRYWGGIRRKQTPESRRKNSLQHQISDINHTVIAQIAAEQIQDNELIFIGSGTTTLAVSQGVD